MNAQHSPQFGQKDVWEITKAFCKEAKKKMPDGTQEALLDLEVDISEIGDIQGKLCNAIQAALSESPDTLAPQAKFLEEVRGPIRLRLAILLGFAEETVKARVELGGKSIREVLKESGECIHNEWVEKHESPDAQTAIDLMQSLAGTSPEAFLVASKANPRLNTITRELKAVLTSFWEAKHKELLKRQSQLRQQDAGEEQLKEINAEIAAARKETHCWKTYTIIGKKRGRKNPIRRQAPEVTIEPEEAHPLEAVGLDDKIITPIERQVALTDNQIHSTVKSAFKAIERLVKDLSPEQVQAVIEHFFRNSTTEIYTERGSMTVTYNFETKKFSFAKI